MSWLIVLYGAELSFAHQNVDTYEFEPDALGASHRMRTLLSLQITHHLIANFRAGERALTASEISNRLEIPIRFVNDILFELVESNILATTDNDDGTDPAYQPALDPDRLTIQYVMEAIERRGINAMPFIHAQEFETLSASLESFRKAINQLPENILLKNL